MIAKFCALCTSDVPPFTTMNIGKDDALVVVCDRCVNEHPREGRYSFGEATRTIARTRGHKTQTRRGS